MVALKDRSCNSTNPPGPAFPRRLQSSTDSWGGQSIQCTNPWRNIKQHPTLLSALRPESSHHVLLARFDLPDYVAGPPSSSAQGQRGVRQPVGRVVGVGERAVHRAAARRGRVALQLGHVRATRRAVHGGDVDVRLGANGIHAVGIDGSCYLLLGKSPASEGVGNRKHRLTPRRHCPSTEQSVSPFADNLRRTPHMQ
jgi:hypothetical protein